MTNAWRSDFAYDGMLRRRLRKEWAWNGSWVQTNEVRYAYDANLVIQERDTNNLPQVTYTRGADLSGTMEDAGGIGGLLARTDSHLVTVNPTRAHAYYHCDGNGNITALADTNGYLQAKYEYDPYGNTIAMSGPLATANLCRFSSKEFHGASGLYYYVYRFYEPTFQRWLTRDPDPHGPALDRFALNNPIGNLDPFGLCDKPLSEHSAATYLDAEVFGPQRAINAFGHGVLWLGGKTGELVSGMRHSENPFARGLGAGLWGASFFLGGPEEQGAAKAARMAELLAARHVALDALTAAEEALAERMPELVQAKKVLERAAVKYDEWSLQFERAYEDYLKAVDEVAPFRKAKDAAEKNWEKANAAALECR